MLRQKLMGSTGKEPAYIEDFFQTWLRTGTGSSATVTTGLNASINKSLVWTKSRSAATNHKLTDTVRGATKALSSNTTSAEATDSQGLTAFSSTGYTIGTSTDYNNSGATYVDWQLIAQPKFFDVVTYTGNGSNRTIAHSLGSVPGCIFVKRIDSTADWQVYHRSNANTQYMVLNSTAAVATGATRWNSTTPTSTVFSLGTDATVNASGVTYVAYLFAHDAGGFGLTGTDNVISCGSYTGNGSLTAGPQIDLGYEPQWLMVKRATGGVGGGWLMMDAMRGFPVSGTFSSLEAQTSDAEGVFGSGPSPTATGFVVNTNQATMNQSGSTYIYIAIRRGPMKVPTTGTSVFAPLAYTGNGTTNIHTTGFPVDMTIGQNRQGTGANPQLFDRLRGMVANTSNYRAPVLFPNTTNEEFSNYSAAGDSNTSWVSYSSNSANASGVTYANWNFQRAPGFFDEVCYRGSFDGETSGTANITHNLCVAPELVIIKARNNTTDWFVYPGPVVTTNRQYMRLSSTNAVQTASLEINTPIPSVTSTTFKVTNDPDNSSLSTYRQFNNYVAYLFATCPGVSKVFSYTGNGSSQTINCGFTGGARFILIKRTDLTGDWYVWDTARGIVAGNDPHLSLNTTAAEVTTDDTIDTDSTGFVVNQVAATNVNVNAATYIGLAIS
jgi:hypothetical protein